LKFKTQLAMDKYSFRI